MDGLDVLQEMKKHFPKLRRILAATTCVGPALIFGAFLFFAAGQISLTSFFGAGLLGMIVMLPAQLLTGARDREIAKDSVNWPERMAFILFLFWLTDVPEFQKLLDRVSESDGLWDWRLILAGAIWAAYSIFRSLRSLAQLSDEGIYRFISAKESQKIQAAEHVVGGNGG